MERRLFIAIPLPENVIQMLDATIADVEPSLPRSARLVPRDDWHLTVLFLGGQNEEIIPRITAGMSAVTSPNGLAIEFERVVYGPPGRPPRMVWATTTEETSKRVGELKHSLEAEFQRAGIRWLHREFGKFAGHVTLARFEKRDGMEPVDEVFGEQFVPRDLVLFDSCLEPEGPTYTELFRSSL